jgi:hypothetical protein
MCRVTQIVAGIKIDITYTGPILYNPNVACQLVALLLRILPE